jgi:hypothetical protein
VLRFGQFSQVDHEVRGNAGQALAGVAGVERPEPGAHQFGGVAACRACSADTCSASTGRFAWRLTDGRRARRRGSDRVLVVLAQPSPIIGPPEKAAPPRAATGSGAPGGVAHATAAARKMKRQP